MICRDGTEPSTEGMSHEGYSQKKQDDLVEVSHFAGNLSEFDALLGPDASVERMLDFFHLGD